MTDDPVGRPMGRLTVVDDLLLRDHRRPAHDPVVIQGIWIGESAIPAATIRGIHDRLAETRLGFRVRPTSFPGARREWVAADARHPIDRTELVSGRHLLRWADSRPHDDLNPLDGPGWRLSTAELIDGGCVVAVTCSHALVDGRGLLHLLAEHVPETTSPASDPESVDRASESASDIGDALQQWATVGFGTARAIGGLVASRHRRRELRDYRALQPPARDRMAGVDATPAGVFVEIDRADWDRRARADGGTPNTAFVRAAGRIGAALAGRDRATVGVAVDTRTEPDMIAADTRRDGRNERGGRNRPPADAANAVAMATVPVATIDGQRTVRDRCRGAYTGAVAAPAGFPAQLVQVLPDPIVDRMVPAPGRYDVLCSNLGEAPAELRTIGAVRARSIVGRALGPTGASAALFVLGIGARYSVAVTGRATAGAPTLTELVDRELGPPLRRW